MTFGGIKIDLLEVAQVLLAVAAIITAIKGRDTFLKKRSLQNDEENP